MVSFLFGIPSLSYLLHVAIFSNVFVSFLVEYILAYLLTHLCNFLAFACQVDFHFFFVFKQNEFKVTERSFTMQELIKANKEGRVGTFFLLKLHLVFLFFVNCFLHLI